MAQRDPNHKALPGQRRHQDQTYDKAKAELELLERWGNLDPIQRQREWAVMGEADRKCIREGER